ncbi:unnamed protein product [Macrosiphum euphorbiae]|uniref:Transposase domain-containing protein n=1 Tax=Macrosiphum euphorbiae TaxID=13131 RepID=A0AAV0XZT9_9HEMI|nr:unnamed protein product [Macrosiphum euphorbiae]
MSYQKKSNLSMHSKRRRVNEELKNISLPISAPTIDRNVTAHSTGIIIIPEANLITNVTSVDNVFAVPSQRSINKSPNKSVDLNLVTELGDALSDVSVIEFSSDEDDRSTSYKYSKTSIFMSLVAEWAVNFKISQHALNGLLVILRQHSCFEYLPKDSRTILQTKPINTLNIHSVEPGNYYHFGLANAIKENIPLNFKNNAIHIVAGIDGLPLFKSTAEEFWPILAYIQPNRSNVFPVGIYCGNRKPLDSNTFLKYFVEEINLLDNNGIEINGKNFKVILDVLCCDAPAKSFILKTKGHAGFSSCSRCEHEGEHLLNRMCFPYTTPDNQPSKRTHQNYISQFDEEYHTGNTSILTTVPYFDTVADFSLDYQHLVCLGVVRKVMYLWIKGPVPIRYPSWKIEQISRILIGLRVSIPCEINRKPRSLAHIKNWKATEFRTFLLYLGSSAIKSVVLKEHWKHFFNLSLAMTILLSPDYAQHINIARKLLDNFVKTFEMLYGRHLISHNVHGLTHICDDYIKFGPLDNCSTFPFENYMSTLKNMIRKPDKPLIQVVKRSNEISSLKLNSQKEIPVFTFSGFHKHGPLIQNIQGFQYTTLKMKTFSIKLNTEADSCLLTCNGDIIKVFNIVKDKDDAIFLICKKFQNKDILFDKPIKSSELDIYNVNTLSHELYCYPINEIKKKMILIHSDSNALIALPLIHTSCNV